MTVLKHILYLLVFSFFVRWLHLLLVRYCLIAYSIAIRLLLCRRIDRCNHTFSRCCLSIGRANYPSTSCLCWILHQFRVSENKSREQNFPSKQFLLLFRSIRDWLIWIRYISWLYYTNEMAMVNQWKRVTSLECNQPANTTCFENGQDVLNYYNFKEVRRTKDLSE